MAITNQWWRTPTPSCSPEELVAILTAPNGGHYALPTEPYNEVVPDVFVGDGTTALCVSLLKRLKITHVLNAACGKDRALNLINTTESFYEGSGIKFMGIEALDMSSFHLSPYFEEAAEFIHDAVQNNGRVYVHCLQGISRSATLVLAYLMIKCNLPVQEAVRVVRRNREIIPNQGFLKQLCVLNERLIHNRKFNGEISETVSSSNTEIT
ncbi:dual specificity protein phosphatase 3-like isoform X1 [Dinothrombium tinctorium]|uniref:Dual specificity protein phosphatase n=1 Tax=Dinothrombium tinctorium TaxID=1965070 RepID=A0A3S3P9N3_9ACAR|nr:dual specificity protein phosphatase 3-like isoform X1 [Dinothrombium tinctorium]